jgi:predicted nucleic acid-binding protein
MNQSSNAPNNPSAVILDANVLIAICAKEQDKLVKAMTAFNDYSTLGWRFYAPGVLLAETLYILCGKLQGGSLTVPQHTLAIQLLEQYLVLISPPPSGDFALAARAEAIRQHYGCSRSANGNYLALAEELAQ